MREEPVAVIDLLKNISKGGGDAWDIDTDLNEIKLSGQAIAETLLRTIKVLI